MAQQSTVDVMLIGAIGMLGGSILDGLLSRQQSVRALLRPGKADTVEASACRTRGQTIRGMGFSG